MNKTARKLFTIQFSILRYGRQQAHTVIFFVWDFVLRRLPQKTHYPKNLDFHNVSKVLVLRLDRMGDVLGTLPLIQELRQQFPHLQIDMLVKPAQREAGLICQALDAVHVFGLDQVAHNNLMRKLRSHYDVIIDPAYDRKWHSARLSFQLRAPFRIGYRTGLKALFYSHRILPATEQCYEVQRNLDLLRQWLKPQPSYTFGLKPAIVASQRVHRIVSKHRIASHPLVACHVGAHPTAHNRNWPVAHFARLIGLLQHNLGCDVVLTGGQNEYTKAQEIVAACIASKTSGQLNSTAGKISLPELQTLLGHCDVLVSVFTGPVFLAEAQGTAVVLIQGPTPAWRWTPQQVPSQVVSSGLNCVQLCNDAPHCFRHDQACMHQTSPEKVFQAVQQTLQQLKRLSSSQIDRSL